MSTNLVKLKKKLWIACSTFIKQRDGRKCFTCGKEIQPGKGLHCGHFIPSKECGVELRYDEVNLHVQCFYCNRNLGGFGAIYYVKMVITYGQLVVDSIIQRYLLQKNNRVKWTEQDYMNKIDYYNNKNKYK